MPGWVNEHRARLFHDNEFVLFTPTERVQVGFPLKLFTLYNSRLTA